MYISIRVGGTNGCGDRYDTLDSVRPAPSIEFPISQHSEEEPGDFERDYLYIIEAILLHVLHGNSLLRGIALVVAGDPDADRQMIAYAGNLGHWIGKPIVARLRERFNVPVILSNDAEASALAEAAYGICSAEFAGVDFHEVVWGTGVGGGPATYVEAGTPGAFHLNGRWVLVSNKEYGHTKVSDDHRFTCRGHKEFGHLEAYAGGGNLEKNYGKPGEKMTKEELRKPLWWMIEGLQIILDERPARLIVFMGGVIYHQQWILQEMQDALQNAGYDVLVRLSAFGKSADTLGGLASLRQ